VDVINFGEVTFNTKKLEAFINSVMNEEKESHLLTIPPGPHILSDIILTSSVVSVEGQVVNPTIGGSSSDGFDYGGIDPNVEPDLAYALRMSIEDENRRKEKEKLEKQKTTTGTSKEEKKEEKKTQQTNVELPNQQSSSGNEMIEEDNDQEMDEKTMREAINLSLMGSSESKVEEPKKEKEKTEIKKGKKY